MKFTVALIYGGEGYEHDVSLVGAKNLSGMIDRERYDVVSVFISRSGEWFIEDNGSRIPTFPTFMEGRSGLLKNGDILEVDISIPLLHGDLGEDGVIVGALKAAHIKFVGCDVLAGAVCSDKIVTKLVCDALGMPTAKWTFSDKDDPSEALEKAERYFGYPMFIKPASLGSSIGISRVENEAEFREAYKSARLFSKRVLIEEEIKIKCELECAYLSSYGKNYFKVGRILSNGDFYDFDKKYISHTETDTKRVNEDGEIEGSEMAKKLAEAVGIRQIARIDFFLVKDGRILFNEINTFPGMTKTSLYPLLTEKMGLERGEFINRLISETLI